MADISAEVKKVEEASRGEEVRDAIVDSLNKINEDRTDLEESVSDVKEELEGKQDMLTFDDAPAEDSVNPVTSKGIKKAIEEAVGAVPEDTDTTYTLSIAGNVLTLTPSSGDAQSVTLPAGSDSGTDSDTTYTLSIAGNVLTLTPSSGDAQSVTLPTGSDSGTDNDTTYTLSIEGNVLTLTPSSGDAQSVTLPTGSDSGTDNDTTYTLTIDGNVLTLTSSSGESQSVSLLTGSGGSVSADWSVTDETAEGFIKNKPAIAAGTGSSSILEGSPKEASDDYAHAEGCNTVASKSCAHAEGMTTTASGYNSHAEGQSCTASGSSCHAEGMGSTASGSYAHAEGYRGSATGSYSHAEGYQSSASSTYTHAEGYQTTASGTAAHAEGYGTTANGSYQHVFGKYNVKDTKSAYAEIVGNGSASAASNARTLDWSGNEVIAGKMTVGAAPEADMDLTTKKYVDDLIAALQATVDELKEKINGTTS